MLALALDLARHQAGQTLEPLPLSGAVLVGLAAVVVVLFQGFWQLARHVHVIAHEGAHALVSSGMGGKVAGVKLMRDATGETTAKHPNGRGTITTLFIGYLGPSAFGLGAAKLIALGYIDAVLWLAVILLAILLFSLRTLFGVISVMCTGGILFFVARSGQAGLQTVVAYGLAWFLLLSGVRAVLEHRSGAKDAQLLRGKTLIPRMVWFGIWLAGTIAALGAGGSLLV